jgi:hypothetical protein
VYRFEDSFKVVDLIAALEDNEHHSARIMISDSLDIIESHYLKTQEGLHRYTDYKHMYNVLMDTQEKHYEAADTLLQQRRDLEQRS